MIYPTNYALIEQDELTYVDGGSAFSDFASDIKNAFTGLFSAIGSDALGALSTGATVYGAIVDVIHIPAMISALGQGYTLKQIADYTFGFNEDGTVDTSKFLFNSLNLAAGVYAMYRGGVAVAGLIKK